MDSKKNLLGAAIKKWLKNPRNQEKWEIIKKELCEYAEVLEQLKKHSDFYVPLRLACSGYLSRGTDNANILFPKTYTDFISIWAKIRPRKNEHENSVAERFNTWLNSRGNYRFSKKLSASYSKYFKDFEPKKDFEELSKIKTKDELKKFWRKYEQIGLEYSKNIPMDERHTAFLYSIKIDARLNSLLKGTKYQYLDNNEKEKIFLKAGKQNQLTGWETDRICYNFKDEIKKLIA